MFFPKFLGDRSLIGINTPYHLSVEENWWYGDYTIRRPVIVGTR